MTTRKNFQASYPNTAALNFQYIILGTLWYSFSLNELNLKQKKNVINSAIACPCNCFYWKQVRENIIFVKRSKQSTWGHILHWYFLPVLPLALGFMSLGLWCCGDILVGMGPMVTGSCPGGPICGGPNMLFFGICCKGGNWGPPPWLLTRPLLALFALLPLLVLKRLGNWEESTLPWRFSSMFRESGKKGKKELKTEAAK